MALLCATAVPSLARQSPALAITAPADGTAVAPGQTFSITVASPAGQTFVQVAVFGEDFIGFAGSATTLPAQFTVAVPADAALKRYSLSAVAGTGSGDPIIATIQIDVERPDLPTAIRADVSQVVFPAQGQSSAATLLATFSDGVVVDATTSSKVTYISSNPSVATMDADGVITGVGPGVAEVTATYTVASESRRALIRIIVPPPPYSLSPSILDFGDQEVDTIVGSQMVLTNSNGHPLSITAVVASSEFEASGNCVGASPLAEGATCTVVVTFAPAATGLREGVLQISEADDVVRFRLKGTGVQAQPVTVSGFSPSSGPIGTSVTITGTGFSATPSQNTVTFNGVAATITSAAPTSIDVTVPPGATTGPVTVTRASGSATSATSFTVTLPPPPTITGFTPTIGAAGTSVTITGTAFSAVAANNQTKFNNSASVPTASTTTTVTAPVPVATTSGRITITTAAGTATSSTDFVVPPSPYVAADVSTSGRIAFGTGTTITVAANQIGLLLFDGASGQRISLLGTNGMAGQILGCDVNVSILKPDATMLAAATCMEGIGFIDVKTVPAAGTYTILVDPVGAATGSVTLTLYDVPADAGASVTPGGSAATITMFTPGQNGIVTFTGTAGQRVSLRGTNGLAGQVSFACDVAVSIVKPDNGVLVPPACMESTGFVDIQVLPASGSYKLAVDPLDWAIGNLTLTLYDVPADVTGTITPGGSAVTVSMPTPGQGGALTFAGTAGDRISLRGTNGLSGQIAFACDVAVSIVKPDNGVLAAPTCVEGTGFIDTKTLPLTGTYTVVVNPETYSVGSVTLTLYSVPADVTGSLTIGAAPVAVSLGTPGMSGVLTFSGTASQQITVRLTSSTIGWTTVRLMKPDGSQLTIASSFTSSFDLSTQTLPVTGTYTVIIDPNDANAGVISVAVTNP